MHGRHVVHGCRAPRNGLEAVGDAAGTVLGGEVEPDVVRVIGGSDPLVARDDVPGLRVPHVGHLLEGDEALPFVLAVPSRHGSPAVRRVADRDASAQAVAELALDIGVHVVVHGLVPRAHGLFQIVCRASEQD